MAGTLLLAGCVCEHFPPSRELLPSLWVLLCQILGAIFCFTSLASFPPGLLLGCYWHPQTVPHF